MGCEQCEVVYVNGLRCHEHGCPVAYQDEERECAWCGQTFAPEFPRQNCCDEACAEAYRG